MAAATGNSADVQTYTTLLNSLNTEFNTAFISKSNGNTYDTGLQSAQVLPLWMNIVPESSIYIIFLRL